MMTPDLDILALRHVPQGWREVLTYQTQYCSLEREAEFPGVVCMRAIDDPGRWLWVVCTRFDADGNRFDEERYDADQPYMHPACDEDGNVRMIVRHDKADAGTSAHKRTIQ